MLLMIDIAKSHLPFLFKIAYEDSVCPNYYL